MGCASVQEHLVIVLESHIDMGHVNNSSLLIHTKVFYLSGSLLTGCISVKV